MRLRPLILALALLPLPAVAQPDLSGTIPVLEETFDGPLKRYDGKDGLWSRLRRTGQIMTNAQATVFLEEGVLGEDAGPIPTLHEITDDGLSLRSARLPEAVLPVVRDYMRQTGQGGRADQVRYASGQITTAHTWSQTYGYYEIEARFPRGKGRWGGFWMTFAGPGWPPEIDVVEAYGAGLDSPTKKDGTFNTAVFFDRLDAEGEPTLEVEIENPFATGEDSPTPRAKQRGDRMVYNFFHLHDAAADGADIYGEFNTYAALWTPEHVIYYFGKDRESLREIYRAPTPEDAHSPMYVIANDHFTARGGWWSPREEAIDRVLSPDNDMRIRRITVRAFEPGLRLDMAEGDAPDDDRDSVITDTSGDDVIAPGGGFDLVRLTGGADRIVLQRGRHQKIVSGFGADDRLELEGFPFADGADALSRLTQVGPDVWLPSGADPAWPQTIVFRDSEVAEFSAEQFTSRWPVGLKSWHNDPAGARRPAWDEDGDGVLTAKGPGAWMTDRGKPVRMEGSESSDRYIVSNPGSEIVTQPGSALHRVDTRYTMTLPENVHHGIASGQGIRLTGHDGPDRLEAAGARTQLEGGAGDDLYIIRDSARGTIIRIFGAPGHDRLRGFGEGSELTIGPDLWTGRDGWKISETSDGTRIDFGQDQSLLIEGMDRTAAERALGLQ